MSDHRWSGRPRAWCLDCGSADPIELCIGDHAEWDESAENYVCPDASHKVTECPAVGAGEFDPYITQRVDP